MYDCAVAARKLINGFSMRACDIGRSTVEYSRARFPVLSLVRLFLFPVSRCIKGQKEGGRSPPEFGHRVGVISLP